MTLARSLETVLGEDLVGAVETAEIAAVAVRPEGDGQLVAYGRVLEGRQRRGVTAVDVALLEGPEGRDDEVVLPLRRVPA